MKRKAPRKVWVGPKSIQALEYIREHPATRIRELAVELHGEYNKTTRRNTYTICERLEEKGLVVGKMFVKYKRYWAVE